MPSWWSRLPLFWRAQIVGWGLFSAINVVTQSLAYEDLGIAVSRSALVFAAALALSGVLRGIYVRHDVASHLSVPHVVLATAMSFAAGAAVSGLLFAGHLTIGWDMPTRSEAAEFVIPFGHYTVAFMGWHLCYFWIHAELMEQAEHRHAMRAEAEALRAELEELRLQLDPHFLFNALNGVAEEIPERPQAALAMLRDLTAYLRHSLNGIHQTVMTLEAEIAGLSAYLRVQQARFGERLRVIMDVDPAAGPRKIASFLLQPLVENAVKHGRREEGLELRIAVAVEGTALRIEIDNSGTLKPSPAPHRPAGIGLANVRRRLELHYPGRHSFTLDEKAPGKVEALLRLEGEPCSGS